MAIDYNVQVDRNDETLANLNRFAIEFVHANHWQLEDQEFSFTLESPFVRVYDSIGAVFK